MAKRKAPVADASTEEKIKEAARKIFTRKGFAATRTRDIASEAGINLALVNYYFRSKEKLFRLVMMESIAGFVKLINEIVHHPDTSLVQKLEKIVEGYIDQLVREPNFPFFILSEIQSDPEMLLKETGIRESVMKSVFIRQVNDHFRETGVRIHPIHFLMNFAGLTVFPFVSKPMIRTLGNLNDKEFNLFMEERKRLIPVWIHAMLNVKS